MNINGYKTYIAGIALICWAVGGAVAGKLDYGTAVAEVIAAFGLMGLRHGIAN